MRVIYYPDNRIAVAILPHSIYIKKGGGVLTLALSRKYKASGRGGGIRTHKTQILSLVRMPFRHTPIVVLMTGIEPANLAVMEPKSIAYASFATSAYRRQFLCMPAQLHPSIKPYGLAVVRVTRFELVDYGF